MTKQYAATFTTGGLFHSESLELAKLYSNLEDWEAVRARALEENTLQARTLSTLKRVCREVISRLRTLTLQELKLLLHSSHQEQAYLLWIACCRRYTLIADFAVEVLRERYISFKKDLTAADFVIFFNRKADWHAELDALSDSTRNKLRQVLFLMMREAGLLDTKNQILPVLLTPRLASLLRQHGNEAEMFFPT